VAELKKKTKSVHILSRQGEEESDQKLRSEGDSHAVMEKSVAKKKTTKKQTKQKKKKNTPITCSRAKTWRQRNPTLQVLTIGSGARPRQREAQLGGTTGATRMGKSSNRLPVATTLARETENETITPNGREGRKF